MSKRRDICSARTLGASQAALVSALTFDSSKVIRRRSESRKDSRRRSGMAFVKLPNYSVAFTSCRFETLPIHDLDGATGVLDKTCPLQDGSGGTYRGPSGPSH